MHRIRFRLRLSALPRPLADFRGLTSKKRRQEGKRKMKKRGGKVSLLCLPVPLQLDAAGDTADLYAA